MKGIVERIKEVNTVSVSGPVTRENLEEYFKSFQESITERQKYVDKTKEENLEHLYRKSEEFGEDVPVVLLAYCIGAQQPPMIPEKIYREHKKWFEDEI